MKYSLLIALFAFFLSNCDKDGLLHCERGSGEIESEQRSVLNFSSLEMRGNMDVQITQDTFFQVIIEAQANILRRTQAWVSSDRLIVDVDGCIRNHKDITIFITMPDIQDVHLSGSGNIISKNTLLADYLDVRIDGSGDIDLTVEMEEIRSRIDGSGDIRLVGNALTHEIEIDGSGDMHTFDLNTDETNIDVSGSGDCYIKVNEMLTVNIRGSGNVHYIGFPSVINTKIEGSGNVIDEN